MPYVITTKATRPEPTRYGVAGPGVIGQDFRRAVAALEEDELARVLFNWRVGDELSTGEMLTLSAILDLAGPGTDAVAGITVAAVSWEYLAREGGNPSHAAEASSPKAYYAQRARESILRAVNRRWATT